MLAMRLRHGKPSGVDTTDVPALITTRLASDRSCLLRIIVRGEGVTTSYFAARDFCLFASLEAPDKP